MSHFRFLKLKLKRIPVPSVPYPPLPTSKWLNTGIAPTVTVATVAYVLVFFSSLLLVFETIKKKSVLWAIFV